MWIYRIPWRLFTFTYCWIGPKFPKGAIFTTPATNNEMYSKDIRKYRVWLLARVVGTSEEKQPVPGFGGFISVTSAEPARKSIIDHSVLSDQHFSEYSTSKELLKQPKNGSMEMVHD